MKKYIFDNKKELNIFLSVEKVLNENTFPEMTKIENEEIAFLNRNLTMNSSFIEIGCGGGRVLKKIKKDFEVHGSEINKFFIEYCKNNGLNVFYLDALRKVPKEKQEKYDFVFLAYNLFYNFYEKDRLKIIKHANSLLKKEGKLIITFFDSRKITLKIQKEMIEYYKKVINVPSNFEIKVLDKNLEKGIGMKRGRKLLWFSRWKTDREIVEEFSNWKGFKLIKIEKGKNSIASFVILRKK